MSASPTAAPAAVLFAALTFALTAQGVRAQADLRQRITEFSADVADLQRRYDVPFSSERTDRLRARYEREVQELEALDFEALGRDARIDWLLLGNHVNRELERLAAEVQEHDRLHGRLRFAQAIVDLCEARRRHEDVDGKAVAETLTQIAETASQLADYLQKQFPVEMQYDADRVQSLRRALGRWFRFRDGYDPSFSWWARAPYEQVEEQLDRMEVQLRKHVRNHVGDTSLAGKPIGEAALKRELRYEWIPYTPAELVAIAEQEFRWCDAEMAKAAAAMGCGDDWRRALQQTKERHRPPGEQPQMIRELAQEAITFLRQRDLITIPELAEECWRMRMMSPARQRVNPFFLGGETIQVSFPTDAMSHREKLMSLRSNNEHFCRATVHHELIPGHWLQQYSEARYKTYRRPFRTPFWTEGWALYWEMRFYDLGLAATPEDKVGFLYWRKHRCARIVFSLNFQLGVWDAAKCIEYLIDRVGHEPAAAEAEVRRSISGGYGPLYQAAYMLGGLQFRALNGELVDGNRWTEKEFHDAVLRQGNIPIAVLRAALREKMPARELSGWRFVDGD